MTLGFRLMFGGFWVCWVGLQVWVGLADGHMLIGLFPTRGEFVVSYVELCARYGFDVFSFMDG